ncbi:glycolipid transfer protein 3-like [Solanum dulcamara]|uniref:glycolipid transfer protein 3-like n=1 Tax=Solanum dulcamara TaxID=45834 RepID=UPI0024859A24|nr:glycolipid transfer protein 3-like [Solanum dulcamara]
MKRRRDMEVESTEITSCIEELSMMKLLKVKLFKNIHDQQQTPAIAHHDNKHNNNHHIPTMPFLSISNLVLQVLDKIGPTMAVLRQDIYQNIQRLEKVHDLDPAVYSNMVEILKKESNEGKETKGPSCSKALLWLTRSLDFTLALLELLAEDLERNMVQAVQESYTNTLKPWHGWISSAAFKVALKLVPDSKDLITILKGKDKNNDDFKKELRTFISLLAPLLKEIHDVLDAYGLDRLKST